MPFLRIFFMANVEFFPHDFKTHYEEQIVQTLLVQHGTVSIS